MTQNDIIAMLLAYIGADDAPRAAPEDAFNDVALQVFAYQFENNRPFRQFSIQRGRTPRTARSWRDIPAVPIKAFKELTLSCCAPEQAERVFMTSGTTLGGVRGKSYHPTLSVYDASMIRGFKQYFMPDRDRIDMSILFPTEDVMPNSSLAHYLALALAHFGTPESGYAMQGDGIAYDQLFETLDRAQISGTPFALLGASYSYVPLLDEMEHRGLSFALPAGSRLFDTGGFKGQSRELGLDEFYDRLSASFGVPRGKCTNMYGMTELSTQFYDRGNAVCPSVKSGPHWIRSRVINPLTGEDVPFGETGVLVHCDLAHFNIVSTILTEDAGVETEDGFRLLGRADGAEAKGCSMAVEEFLKAAQA